MLKALRHRRLLPLRLLMLVLVGMGVFGTSLASALTDIHMLAHTDLGTDVHKHDDTALALAPDAEDSANALLHALVHCVDCHGHGGVLPVISPTWRISAPPAQQAPAAMTPQLASHPTESLFRPPIAG
jgi:mono/diheme cytochrome c family protein